MSNKPEDISDSLTRELVLRNFNRKQLNLQTSLESDSDLKKIIGVGFRKHPKTGSLEKITNFYPSHLKEIVSVFEYFPVFEHFGITVKDAMSLPVNEWIAIRKAVERIGPKEPKPSGPSEDVTMLLQVIQQLVTGKGEGG